MDKFPKLPPSKLSGLPRPAMPKVPRPTPDGPPAAQGPSLPPVALGQHPGLFPRGQSAPTIGMNLPVPPDVTAQGLESLRESMADDLRAEQDRIGRQKEIYHRNRFSFNNMLGGSLGDDSED